MVNDPEPELVAARVAELGRIMGSQLTPLTELLHRELNENIRELQGDALLLDLLFVSVESNLKTVSDLLSYTIDPADLTTPTAAREYARRLAQHYISSNALVRAYRLGHELLIGWGLAQIRELEEDADIAYSTATAFASTTFRYIDMISQQVVLEYEMERERWLAHRSTVRAELLSRLITGEPADESAAETSLAYRLRQVHLGAITWIADAESSRDLHSEIEHITDQLRPIFARGETPLFQQRDRTSGWLWLPLGTDPTPAQRVIASLRPRQGVQVALGRPYAGVPGFRATHEEALRAYRVAISAGDSPPLTSYAEPDVRTASMLAADPQGTAEMVRSTLGGLAAGDAGTVRLRETLAVFLEVNGSYVATAERMNLHKNTVKYRIDKAIAQRGRALDEDRLELQLALVACVWLGPMVLPGVS